MNNGSNQCNDPFLCDCCGALACRLKTTRVGEARTTVDVSTNTVQASVDSQTKTSPSIPTDRVGRAKRALEASEERVKKARVIANRDLLRLKHQQAMDNLDRAVLSLEQAREDMDNAPLNTSKQKMQRFGYIVDKMQDFRQLALKAVVDAECALLDFTDDE